MIVLDALHQRAGAQFRCRDIEGQRAELALLLQHHEIPVLRFNGRDGGRVGAVLEQRVAARR